MAQITTTTLDSGLALMVERIPNVASAALTWLAPLGSAGDPPQGDGIAAMLSEMIFRGAGGLSSREHSDALDRLGVQRDSRVMPHHLHASFTLLGARLGDALPLIAAMMHQPALPEEALEPVRSLCLQAIDSLEDDPQHLAMLRLRERHVAAPLNRHGYGQRDTIEKLRIDDLRQAWQQRNRPGGTIIAAAGAVDAAELARRLNELLRGWSGATSLPRAQQPPQRGVLHLEQPTQQVHIGLAWDAPPAGHADTMRERLGISVLSGASSARLFTEVRQKRSLCYSIDASYSAGKETGAVMMYAGTTPERAQETLDVAVAEVHRLGAGAQREEFDRAVIGLKSSLVMQGESTGARAAALASDYFRLGRARSLEEIAAEVDAVSFEALNDYLAQRELGELTLASIGPRPLVLPP